MLGPAPVTDPAKVAAYEAILTEAYAAAFGTSAADALAALTEAGFTATMAHTGGNCHAIAIVLEPLPEGLNTATLLVGDEDGPLSGDLAETVGEWCGSYDVSGPAVPNGFAGLGFSREDGFRGDADIVALATMARDSLAEALKIGAWL